MHIYAFFFCILKILSCNQKSKSTVLCCPILSKLEACSFGTMSYVILKQLCHNFGCKKKTWQNTIALVSGTWIGMWFFWWFHFSTNCTPRFCLYNYSANCSHTVPKDIQKKSDTLLTKLIFYINNCRLDNNGLLMSSTNMDHYHHEIEKTTTIQKSLLQWLSLMLLIYVCTCWDTLCRCPLSGLFWFARQRILLTRQRSLLSIL